MVAIDSGTRRSVLSAVHATTVGNQSVPFEGSTTELDSHANMVVVGEQATIISDSGTYAEVRAFAEDCKTLERVPIVDAAIAYDCQASMRTYILIVRNALHVKSMKHNLLPPFIVREAGLVLNDVPRIHCGNDLCQESHCIVSSGDVPLRIPLRLKGVFSYFPSRKLTPSEVRDCDELPSICITPDSRVWDPNDEAWAEEEDSYLDHDGGLISAPPPRKKRKLIHENDFSHADDAHEWIEINVSSVQWEDSVDRIIEENDIDFIPEGPDLGWADNVDQDDPIRAHVCDLTGVIDSDLLSEAVDESLRESKFRMAAGSTMPMQNEDLDNSLFVNLEASAADASRMGGVTKEHLAKVWRLNEDEARRTLEVTSQLCKRDANSTLSRQFGTNDRMLRYRRLNSTFFMDTFFVTKKAKSVRGFTMMQIFVSDKGFVKVYGMKSLTEIPAAIRLFAKEVGAPNCFVCDPHANQKSKEVREFCHKIGSTLRLLEERTQHANRAELYIGLLKEAVRKDMRETNSPLRLWCYCAERRSSIFTLTAKNLYQLQGMNPYTATLGEMGDISALCQFGWYEWVYVRQGKAAFPHLKEELGRCLGPCRNEGNEMCQAILQANGQIVPRRTLRRLTAHEKAASNEVESRKRATFDAQIRDRFGDSMKLGPDETALLPTGETEARDDVEEGSPDHDFDVDRYIMYEDAQEDTPKPVEADIVDAAGKPVNQQSLHDVLINAELHLPQGESEQLARVVRRSVGPDGKVTGAFNDNPLLNTLVYEVEFPDGELKHYSANIIAENILQQVDNSGYHSHGLKGITDVRKTKHALGSNNAFVVSKSGQRRLRQTTMGWDLKVEWKDGSSQWVPLKVLKESNPVEVAEFAVARDIQREPAFAWWVPFTLRKRDRIIAAIHTRVRKKTHKYGIEVPSSVEHALEIDKKNGNTLWRDAIAKEMYNVSVAFKILEEHENLPVGWTKSSGHFVFDVKMDFTRKGRWVKDGHKSPEPETSSYAGVVSRESIRILLTNAALLGIDVMAADIRNAYLQAPTTEKHFIICGSEFGLEHVGKRALIVRALYGGKVAGRDFWHHLRSCMKDVLGFQSCLADPDVWMREAKRADGTMYYEYVLLYVDDCLVISENAEKVLRDEIGDMWELKEESIGPPSLYLGGTMRQVELENGQMCWAFGSAQYVKSAVQNVEDYLAKKGKSLPAKASTPLSSQYRPELDTTEELEPDDAAYFQSLIGILRWMVELGRVDLCTEVSMMSSHLCMPRKGHLEQLFHVFGYLKKHHNAEMPFDPSTPDMDMAKFPRQDWSQSIYGDVGEALPPNMPKPLGREMVMRVYIDSDHAGESLTRRSRTGFIVYLNKAPIYWMSKKQASCETSTFGSEFCAMKQGTEYVRGLRYKLRMLGIPCTSPTYTFGDNQSVLANTTAPTSQLKKKSNSIAYHFVREGSAKDEWRTTYVNTHENPADLLTKPLPSGEKRSSFIRSMLWWL